MATVAARPTLVKARGPPATLKGRARKGVPFLNTNPASYDRTDPFAALNALRTLLAALPARLGGCAYKLAPDEHRLALHFLTLVEPFVGLAPQRRTLTRQPTEILDAIVFHLDARRDLLNLALACKRLHGVVFPRHYEYRVVRCKISRIAVWNHLAVHRGLARNIRRLEVMDERSAEPESVPSDILSTDTDLESTDDELNMHDKQARILASALTKMTALASFTWSCSHSLVEIDHIWPILLKCQTLQDVQINDNLVFAPADLSPTEDGKGKGKKRQHIVSGTRHSTHRSGLSHTATCIEDDQPPVDQVHLRRVQEPRNDAHLRDAHQLSCSRVSHHCVPPEARGGLPSTRGRRLFALRTVVNTSQPGSH